MAGKVTVVGAGFYGSTTAMRLAEYNVFDTVVLTDILEGKPEGLALDMNQSRSIEGFETKVIGATTTADGAGYEATANSDVVVITAGLPRKPGMSRMDLIGVNAGIVRGVAENIAKHSPNAVIIVVSNPLDEMTALTQIASAFPHNRVMGQAGMLDTARFTNFVAEKLGVPVSSVETLTLGSHGDTMVPVPSRCKVNGAPFTVHRDGTGTIVSPCEPRVKVSTVATGTFNFSATKLVKRAVSNIPAWPMTLWYGNLVAICVSAVISSSGFETTIITAFGECLAIFSATPRTIPAFTPIKSIRLIPGLRGKPAVTTTTSEFAVAS